MKNEKLQDDWGHDPSVQMMRRVFAGMERAQKELLMGLKLSPLDGRLRRVRESALDLFEQAWPRAQRKGLTQAEEDAVALYLHCLVAMLTRARIEVPPGSFPENQKIVDFLSGNFR